MNNKFIVAIILGLTLIVFAIGAIFFKDHKTQEQTKTITSGEVHLVRDHSPAIGNPLYRVSVVEFLDPECESCRAFHPEVKKLLKKYENRIHYVVRYATLHPNSDKAVAFLEAARKQGKFWETLDFLFKNQPEWADHHHPKPELKWTYIDKLGLDETKMRNDVKSPEIQEIIKLDMEDGRRLYVRGTPTFFVNGKVLEKFGPQYLDQAIMQAFGNVQE